MTLKNITICADDYAQYPSVSKGILQLLENQRLTAVSCMVNTPYWQEHAQWLQAFASSVDIGLHFNLTEGDASKYANPCHTKTLPYALPKILLNCYQKRLDKERICIELQQQLDSFTHALNKPPDFIDGHQHVHQFPIVRDALLTVYQQSFATASVKPYIRLCQQKMSIHHTSTQNWLKQKIIYHTGSRQLHKQLKQLQIPYNTSFAGIYNFKHHLQYADIMDKFLQQLDNNGLLMCHPGLPPTTLHPTTDPLWQSRPSELNYLLSQKFIDSLQTHRIQLTRYIR